jgi:uncharacterized membrane protein YraQ (UPF0718 family)
MTKPVAKSGHGRWWFLAIVVASYALCAALAPDLASRALAHGWQALRRMLPVLALVLVLMVVLDLTLRPQQIAQHLGRRGGLRGWLLALVAGILSAGPVYAWYPLLAELRDKGMRPSTAAVFLYARAIKLPLLPLLFHYFGAAYSVVLSLYLAGFALLSGLVMERLDRAAQSAD